MGSSVPLLDSKLFKLIGLNELCESIGTLYLFDLIALADLLEMRGCMNCLNRGGISDWFHNAD